MEVEEQRKLVRIFLFAHVVVRCSFLSVRLQDDAETPRMIFTSLGGETERVQRNELP